MREYGMLGPGFWIGATGKRLRGSRAAQVVAAYLISSPHANMLGLYYLPMPFLVHETGMSFEEASEGLQRCIEAGFCRYDEASEFVWVLNMALYQIGSDLSPKDNRCKGVQAEYDRMPQNPFLSDFYERFSGVFHMTSCRESRKGSERGSEGATKPGTGTGTGTEKKPSLRSAACPEPAEPPLVPESTPVPLIPGVKLKAPKAGPTVSEILAEHSPGAYWELAKVFPGSRSTNHRTAAPFWVAAIREGIPGGALVAAGKAFFESLPPDQVSRGAIPQLAKWLEQEGYRGFLPEQPRASPQDSPEARKVRLAEADAFLKAKTADPALIFETWKARHATAS